VKCVPKKSYITSEDRCSSSNGETGHETEKLIGNLVIIIIVLSLVGFLAFWFIRRRKQQQEVERQNEEINADGLNFNLLVEDDVNNNTHPSDDL